MASFLAFTGPSAGAQEMITTETTITQTPAVTHRGLLKIIDSSTYFWVDDHGIRHYVQNPDVARSTYFVKDPVITVTRQELRTLPVGQSITVERGPDVFRTSPDTTAVLFDKPRIFVEYGAGPTIRRAQIRDLERVKSGMTEDELEDLADLYEDERDDREDAREDAIDAANDD